MGDPTAIRGAASRLRLQAERAWAVHGGGVGRLQTMTFAGPAADRFRAEATSHLQKASMAAAALETAAAHLDAAAVAAEEALLAAQLATRAEAERAPYAPAATIAEPGC